MDITSRRNTVDAMHLCDKALASTSEAIIITDPNLPDNPIIYCNQGFEALTGAPARSRCLCTVQLPLPGHELVWAHATCVCCRDWPRLPFHSARRGSVI
jgi:PAS domain-containing protein